MLASDWFAQAGKARVLKACTSMGRPVSEAMGRSSAEPAKRVGERRERHWVALCVLCVSVVNLPTDSADSLHRGLNFLVPATPGWAKRGPEGPRLVR